METASNPMDVEDALGPTASEAENYALTGMFGEKI
jgi:hypothetical protein